jgi:hypothetical protein
MPIQPDTYRCLLISPSDVDAERLAVTEAISLWNAQVGNALNARVEAVAWETHAVPDLRGSAQEVINSQLVDGCDFGIALFWTRLGSPTKSARSGSMEEIDLLTRQGSRVLVYQCTRAIPQERLRDDQYAQLQQAVVGFRERGLLGQFDSVADLKQLVTLHLTNVVSGLAMGPSQLSAAKIGVATAPLPDIRVSVGAVTAYQSDYPGGVAGERESYLKVQVQNHSPTAFFLSGISFAMSDGTCMYPLGDALNRTYQCDVRLEPGDAHDLHLDPCELLKGVRAGKELMHAFVTDKIGRHFRGSEQQLLNAIQQLKMEGTK